MNRTSPNENYNTTPVKNSDFGQKWVKIGQIVAKFDSNSTQNPINEK